MREWLTAREIAAEQLPDMPATERGVHHLAERLGWADQADHVRLRAGRGGGTEYHVHLLPTLAQVAYAQKHMVVEAPPAPAPAPAKVEADPALTDRALAERDAKLAVVQAFERFARGSSLGYASRVQLFCDKFNAGSISADPWVREHVATVSKSSLARWRREKRSGRSDRLAHDPARARAGTGVLDLAADGRLRAFVLALLADRPHLSGGQVRTQCLDEFGSTVTVSSKGVQRTVEMPPVRTFQHAMKAWKAQHKVELLKLSDPDRYRSTMAPRGIGMLREITEPNQLWQIDASPLDALCTDGRHQVYGCIDIATRRTIWLLAKTARASAVALLIRKAILAWGAPDRIKTDNGSDFTARATARLFASLDIEAETSTAYSPQEKGHIERAIRTMQHDFAPLLPGYVGHSVAERKAIESRKSFAQRLGETEFERFEAALTGAEVQRYLDAWATDIYGHREHAGLGGRTPAQAALTSKRPPRSVDPRALDLLLMPVAGDDGQRVVQASGVWIGRRAYQTPGIMVGTPVLVRQDPSDLGRAYVFEQDGGRYLGEATCPELAGVNPAAFVAAVKSINRELVAEAVAPIKAEMKRIAKGPAPIERALDVAKREAPNVVALPRRAEPRVTPQIAAAIDAAGARPETVAPIDEATRAMQRRLLAEMEQEEAREALAGVDVLVAERLDALERERTAHLPPEVQALPESPKERYRRAVLIKRAVAAGEPVDAGLATWAERYGHTAEFRGNAGVHADFGDAWLFGRRVAHEKRPGVGSAGPRKEPPSRAAAG